MLTKCWWTGDPPLAEPVFRPPDWYLGHVGDYRWFSGHLESLPAALRSTTNSYYGQVYVEQGRQAANTWLRESLYP